MTMNRALVAFALVLLNLSVSFAGSSGAPTCDPVPVGTVLGFESPSQYQASYSLNIPCNGQNGNPFRFGSTSGISSVFTSYDNTGHITKEGSQYGVTMPTSPLNVWVNSFSTTTKSVTSACTRGILGNNMKPYYLGFWYSVQGVPPNEQFAGAALITASVLGAVGDYSGAVTFPISWSVVGGGWQYFSSEFFCAFTTNTFDISITPSAGTTTLPWAVLLDKISVQPWFWGLQNNNDVTNGGFTPPVDNLYLGCMDNSQSTGAVWAFDMGPIMGPGSTYYGIQPGYPNSVTWCQSWCAGYAYPYSGVNGYACYCGTQYGYRGLAPSEASCNYPCPGNSAQMCGAAITSTTTFSSDYKTPYMGCFYDSQPGNQTHDLSYFAGYNASMYVDLCRSTCYNLDYTFAGLQAGGLCFCGNTFGDLGKAPESDCNWNCASQPQPTSPGGWPPPYQKCGAPARNSIFVAKF